VGPAAGQFVPHSQVLLVFQQVRPGPLLEKMPIASRQDLLPNEVISLVGQVLLGHSQKGSIIPLE